MGTLETRLMYLKQAGVVVDKHKETQMDGEECATQMSTGQLEPVSEPFNGEKVAYQH